MDAGRSRLLPAIGVNPSQRKHAVFKAPENFFHDDKLGFTIKGHLDQCARTVQDVHLGLGAGFSQKKLQQTTKPATRKAEYNREERFQEVTVAREKELDLETEWTLRTHRLTPGLARRSLPKEAPRMRLEQTEHELVDLVVLTDGNLPDARKAEMYLARVGGAVCAREGNEPPELFSIKVPADTMRKWIPRKNQIAPEELFAPVQFLNSWAKSSGGRKYCCLKFQNQ